VPEDDFTLISGEPKAFHYIAQSGRGWIGTSAQIAARGCSPTTWKASRE
jgi:hypothetical protein